MVSGVNLGRGVQATATPPFAADGSIDIAATQRGYAALFDDGVDGRAR